MMKIFDLLGNELFGLGEKPSNSFSPYLYCKMVELL